MMPKILNAVFGVLNFSIFLLLMYMLWRGNWAPNAGSSSIEYKDFISILLTALGLMMTILAVIAAVSAFWGYETIKQEAVKKAAEVAANVAPGKALATAAEFEGQTEAGLDYGKSAGGGSDNGHA